MQMQGKVATGQSQQYALKLQPHRQLTTKSPKKVHSGIDNDMPDNSILAAHSPLQVTSEQSDDKLEQTAQIPEQTVGTHAHSQPTERSKKADHKDSNDSNQRSISDCKSSTSSVTTSSKDKKAAHVITSEAGSQARARQFSAATTTTSDKSALSSIG